MPRRNLIRDVASGCCNISIRAGPLNPAALGLDPYRTSYGTSELKLTLTILGIIFGSMGLLALIIFLIIFLAKRA